MKHDEYAGWVARLVSGRDGLMLWIIGLRGLEVFFLGRMDGWGGAGWVDGWMGSGR